MARFNDPYKDLGRVDDETSEQARKRRRREYLAEVEDRALYLVKHDPDVGGDLRRARVAAREQIALETQYEEGTLTPTKDRARRGRSHLPPSRRTPSKAANRPTRARRTTRRTARVVVAPFGSAASAGWTLFQGGLGLVLLYLLLRNAGAVKAATDGITAGLANLTDPYTPLIPDRGEATPAPAARRVHTSTFRQGVKGRQRLHLGGW